MNSEPSWTQDGGAPQYYMNQEEVYINQEDDDDAELDTESDVRLNQLAAQVELKMNNIQNLEKKLEITHIAKQQDMCMPDTPGKSDNNYFGLTDSTMGN